MNLPRTGTGWAKWSLGRVVEIALAALAVFVVTLYLEKSERDRRHAVPPTDWFEVSEVYVPNHIVGSDPPLIYNRVIKEDFHGFWVVEVQRRGQQDQGNAFFAACSGSGSNVYETTDILDPNLVTWSWFIGRDCVIPPGIYRLVVTWDIRRDEGPVKRYRVLSNVFRVYSYEQALELSPDLQKELGVRP